MVSERCIRCGENESDEGDVYENELVNDFECESNSEESLNEGRESSKTMMLKLRFLLILSIWERIFQAQLFGLKRPQYRRTHIRVTYTVPNTNTVQLQVNASYCLCSIRVYRCYQSVFVCESTLSKVSFAGRTSLHVVTLGDCQAHSSYQSLIRRLLTNIDSSVVRTRTRAPGIPGSSLAIAAHFLLCRLKDYCNFADGRGLSEYNLTDGLDFLDEEVISMASEFYAELRSTAATFSDDSIERLVPHICCLMDKLNRLCKHNTDLQDRLSSAETRCMDLNKSFKEKSDQLDTDVVGLRAELDECKAENLRLKQSLRRDLDMERLMRESEEKIAALTADRQQLLTTVQVLEADIICLRGELRQAKAQSRKRRTSVAGSTLLAELTAATETSVLPQKPSPADYQQPPASGPSPPQSRPAPPAPPTQAPADKPFKNILLLGDSHLRYSSKHLWSVVRGKDCIY
ncbi:hypothetical protein J6590_071095 [Homalodisca vitripennis]|nr:hypothetical protein J6590_071095 [Homalodisca vitripennis]